MVLVCDDHNKCWLCECALATINSDFETRPVVQGDVLAQTQMEVLAVVISMIVGAKP